MLLNIGTKLIKKVTATSSEFFNRKMFELLDRTCFLESKYHLLDPASIGRDELYTAYGPYAICAKLQDKHCKLITESDWPALATKLPESNTATADHSPTLTKAEKPIQCYKCFQWGHKVNDPKCQFVFQHSQVLLPLDGVRTMLM